jgi:hypothetical protein
MKRIKVLQLLATVLLGATMMSAQASRTWVSGVGDDANPCSRTAPCKTFAGAISKTAVGGEIDALDPGGFGAVTITKGITIDGGGGQVASVLVNGTNGIVVAAQAGDVVILRNLRINGIKSGSNGGLNGIRWISGKSLHVENCYIFGFTQNGIDIEKSDGGQAFVLHTVVDNATSSGILIKNTVNNVSVAINDSQFNDNAFGIAAEDFSKVSVFHSETSGNSGVGMMAQAVAGGTALVDVSESISAHNATGLQAGGSGLTSTINITGLALFDNTTGINNGAGGTTNTFHTNYNTGTGAPNGIFITPQ